MIELYEERLLLFSREIQLHQRTLLRLRIARMLAFLCVVLSTVQIARLSFDFAFGSLLIGAIALFLFLVRRSQIHERRLLLAQNMAEIQMEEIRIARHDWKWRETGRSYAPAQHLYAHDLDLFTDAGLFQFLHRTGTPAGARTLAYHLLHRPASKDIVSIQSAVKWLAPQLQFRQLIYAHARMAKHLALCEDHLIQWSQQQAKPLSNVVRVMMFLFPIAFIVALVFFLLYGNSSALSFAGLFFTMQMGLMAAHYRRIQHDLEALYSIESTLKEVANMVRLVETTPSDNPRIVELKKQLHSHDLAASEVIDQLGRRFSNVASIQNFAALMLFSGTAAYHLHVYHTLLRWKQQHGAALERWLQVLGEMEFLCSLAQFAYQHPEFVFPTIDEASAPHFINLGHPLIPTERCVSNNISFDLHRFVVLTGSNMSGKSTFLRTLGINMVLANMGAPVCATAAVHQPMDVLVSMRLSDSLSDEASYFYAEVERLRIIFEALQNKAAFVLLDEILRGTNSDDKRAGTVAVLRRLAQSKAFGALATHDLEVCATSDEFPDALTNKCFEVEIRNNELHFDYRLREGICKSRSATFLMKKKGIITGD